MKTNLLLALAMLTIVSCNKFDDTAIWNELKSHEERIVKLETLCSQINTNVASLQTIITALQDSDYITNIAPIVKENTEIGYTITFAKSGSVTIYHGKDGENGKDGANGSDGKDGQDGKDGHTPKISVKQHTDGRYYWTLDGTWLLDNKGDMTPATGEDGKDGANGSDGTSGTDGKDGITPLIKIEDGYWYVSYDKGTTWNQLYKANVEGGANDNTSCNIINSITQDDSFVYINLYDGNTVTLPRAAMSNVSINIGEVSFNSVTFVGAINKRTVDLKVTIYYGEDNTINIYNHAKKVSLVDFGTENNFSILIEELKPAHTYYYFVEVISEGKTTYSNIESFETDQTSESNDEVIEFEDAVAERVCVSKYDKNGDSKLSLSEVSSLESIDGFFFGEYAEAVKSFNEFRYFTSVKELDYCQFEGCVNLKSITLPNNLEKIGYQSFYQCEKLEGITIPNSVCNIGQSAFAYCKSLANIIIPDSVTTMYGSTFSNCYKLSSVEIGDGLKVIPNNAFASCDVLSRIKFGASIEKIERNAFMPSSSAGSEEIKDVIVADLDKWIRVKFEGDYSSPTWIGANLWEGDKLVTKCTIPSDVLSTGMALHGCGSIEEVIIPDGVLVLSDEAFWCCKNLQKATIGKDVVTIGKDAFWGCEKLSSFEGKFVSEDGRCIVVGDELVSHASAGLTEYTIPKGIKSIGYQAFSVTDPEKITIGNDVETIAKSAFFTSGVKEIVLGENVKRIGRNAFGWTNLETIYCNSTTPPIAEYSTTFWDAFNNTPLKNIYVPAESLEAYKTADGWAEYESYIKPYNFN